MRSHFHHGYPKGVHCCVQCTLAVIPVLDAGAIRYFDLPRVVRSGQASGPPAQVDDLPDASILEWWAGLSVTRQNDKRDTPTVLLSAVSARLKP